MKEFTEVRLENLERELAETKAELGRVKRRNLLLLRGGFLIAGLLALVWMTLNTGCSAPFKREATVQQEIRAKKFTLVDEHGMDRATLSIDKDGSGPDLVLTDKNYHIRIILGLGKSGNAGLILNDDNGLSRASLSVNKGGPSLVLLDEKGKGKIISHFDIPD